MKTNTGISKKAFLSLAGILLMVTIAIAGTIDSNQFTKVKMAEPVDLMAKHQISKMTVCKLPEAIPGSGRVYAAKLPMLKDLPTKQMRPLYQKDLKEGIVKK